MVGMPVNVRTDLVTTFTLDSSKVCVSVFVHDITIAPTCPQQCQCQYFIKSCRLYTLISTYISTYLQMTNLHLDTPFTIPVFGCVAVCNVRAVLAPPSENKYNVFPCLWGLIILVRPAQLPADIRTH